ncbi:MAG: triose-phosphate isomerase [Candidatus Lokiarchaeota archaeon]
MRKPIIGGNWKMHNGSPEKARELLESLISKVKNIDNVDIIVAPPFTALAESSIVTLTNIHLGAQNMYFEDQGAYTGEISPKFLKSLKVEYVILGHSERRNIFDESSELINKKVKKALDEELIPIVCIGEHLEERKQGQTKDVIKNQIEQTFADLSKEDMNKIIIAYEPIWAIGTGETATPEQAEEIHAYIREYIKEVYDKETSDSIRIQYGGSIKPYNAEDLFKQKNIDGGLVGGASLEAESFAKIIEMAQKTIEN